jgi:nucleoside-diphosphate-sugar epimerase
MSNANTTVLVTGAAGYLGSWIVDYLLRDGFKVNGTIRSFRDKSKYQHLLKLDEQYPGQLKLHEADLLQAGSFDDAVNGCEIVIHAASPYLFEKPENPEQELILPAIEGTRNVLDAVNKTSSVKRVVVTSSVVSLYSDACEVDEKRNFTVQEKDINDAKSADLNPYAYSKTQAEALAWDIHRQQQRWSLVTIHPGAIFGPSLSARDDSTSVNMMIQFLNGSFRSGVPKLWLGLVDVRDVAEAHVRAAINDQAKNRYIVVAESLRLLEIAKLMAVEKLGLPNKLPKGEAPKFLMWLIAPFVGMQRSYVSRNVNYPLKFNNDRSKTELGVSYRSPVQTLNDHIQQIVNDGLLTRELGL